MATSATVHERILRSEDKEPNHIVIWLDQNFRHPNNYRILKRTFASNIDPRCEVTTLFTDVDYETLLSYSEDAISTTDERSLGLLHVFDREEDFFDFLGKNGDKRIFFITSGALGRITVPKIIARYPQLFTNPITNTPYSSIYILCLSIAHQMDWGDHYLDYVQMFNFDAELLQRLTRDIADYYVERGTRLRNDENLKTALLCLQWAMRLYYNYDKMQQNITDHFPREVRVSPERRRICRLIEEMEHGPVQESINKTEDSADDDGEAEPCS